MLMLAGIMAIGIGVDPRSFGGAPVWLKPTKFALSLALHALTLAWFMGYVRPGFARGWPGRVIVVMVVSASLFEMAYIAWRASRGEASHYNYDTVASSVLYSLMGLAAVLLIAAAAILAVGVTRGDQAIGRPYRLSIILGLGLSFAISLIVGFVLASGQGHWIGGDQTDATGLPLVGWSTTGGDLRFAHFIGLHIMQGLPLIGLACNRLRPALGRTLVCVAAAVWVGLTVWLALIAMAGRPGLLAAF